MAGGQALRTGRLALREEGERIETNKRTNEHMTRRSEKSPEEARWEAAIDAIDARVAARLGPGHRLEYAAYPEVDGVPVDNLDEVPIVGRVRFRDCGGTWRGPVLESPTWLEICAQAEAMLVDTDAGDHCFLEAVSLKNRDPDGVQVAEFSMGS
jgi:hypothetical protein